MKKILIIVCAVVILLFGMVECTAKPQESTNVAEHNAEQQELTNLAVYEDWQLELTGAEKYTNDDGQQYMRVTGVYTNNSADPEYGLACFAVRAFQHDTELTECTDINGDESSLTVEVKNGASVEVAYVFELTDDSEVEVLIGTPTSDQYTIGRVVYLTSEE